jgi:predicted DNA-binding protein YlxM (UPF0122 family)
MKDIVYLTILFDYYEKLLTEKDQKCFKDYYFNNLSLSEIAENNKVSRNAIHKRLKKIEEELNSCEEKLKLYKKEQQILDLLTDDKQKELVKNILNS